MATAQEIEEHFATPLRGVLGDPRGDGVDPAAFYDALSEDLAPFTVHQLGTAVKAIRRAPRKRMGFPTIEECLGACRSIVPDPAAPSVKARTFKTREEREAEELSARQRRRAAAGLCRCELGAEADREGWLIALIDFAEDYGRLPETARELADVKALARRSEDGLADCRQSPLYLSFCRLRKAMLEKASREVFGLSEPSARSPRPARDSAGSSSRTTGPQ